MTNLEKAVKEYNSKKKGWHIRERWALANIVANRHGIKPKFFKQIVL